MQNQTLLLVLFGLGWGGGGGICFWVFLGGGGEEFVGFVCLCVMVGCVDSFGGCRLCLQSHCAYSLV